MKLRRPQLKTEAHVRGYACPAHVGMLLWTRAGPPATWRPGGGRGHGFSSVSTPCLLPAPGNSPVFGAAPGLGVYIQTVSGLGFMTQWSYRSLIQVRMLRTEGLGVHGHTDRNDWQNENLNPGRCGQFYILCPSH